MPYKHQGAGSKQSSKEKQRIRRLPRMTSCGRRCRGASTSTSRCIRRIVWITHFRIGVKRARRVRGKRPLYTTKNVCEEGVILIDSVSVNCTSTRWDGDGKGGDQPSRSNCDARGWNTNSGLQVRLWTQHRRIFLGTTLPNESQLEQWSGEGDLLTDWMRSAVVIWRYVTICGSIY